MKVCHVTSLHPPFDVRIFHKECRSLAQAGYDVTLVAPADFKEKVVDGVRVVGVSRMSRRRQRSRTWRELVAVVRRLQPDVVHFHDPDLLLVAPFFGRCHLIYDCHEQNAMAMLNKPWLPRPLRYPAYLSVSFLEPWLARRTSAIVLVVESQANTFRRTGKPLVLVKNYPIVAAQPAGHQQHVAKTVVHVGAHARSRGCSVMIEAFAPVARQIADARLWLVGPFNHRPYEQEARALIDRLGLQEVVQVVGQVPYLEALEWVSRAAIGLIAYQPVRQYQQCVPTKVLEYMAAGLPVVASDVVSNRDIIAEAGCGILVAPADPQQYAAAIVRLLSDPDEAKRLGENGRQRVLARYDWRQQEEKLLALYAAIDDGRSLPHQVGEHEITTPPAPQQGVST